MLSRSAAHFPKTFSLEETYLGEVYVVLISENLKEAFISDL